MFFFITVRKVSESPRSSALLLSDCYSIPVRNQVTGSMKAS